MNAFRSLRRIAPVVALALLGLAASPPAVQAGDFYASGEFTVTSAHLLFPHESPLKQSV